jgi:hypothetical protein
MSASEVVGNLTGLRKFSLELIKFTVVHKKVKKYINSLQKLL